MIWNCLNSNLAWVKEKYGCNAIIYPQTNDGVTTMISTPDAWFAPRGTSYTVSGEFKMKIKPEYAINDIDCEVMDELKEIIVKEKNEAYKEGFEAGRNANPVKADPHVGYFGKPEGEIVVKGSIADKFLKYWANAGKYHNSSSKRVDVKIESPTLIGNEKFRVVGFEVEDEDGTLKIFLRGF